MTYETSQWCSCNIHIANWSLLWSARGLRGQAVFQTETSGISSPLKLAGRFLLSSRVNLQRHINLTKPWSVQMVKASHITYCLNCVGSSWLLLFFFKSNIQQFSLIEIHPLKPPNTRSAKQTCSSNTRPQLLGFLQLSLYKSSAIANFHLLGIIASSCMSSRSLENNMQTMKTLPWTPFSWAGK